MNGNLCQTYWNETLIKVPTETDQVRFKCPEFNLKLQRNCSVI